MGEREIAAFLTPYREAATGVLRRHHLHVTVIQRAVVGGGA